MCDTVDSSGCTVRGTTRGLKRSWQNKVPGHGHEVSPLYSCRNLMAMQFATDISTEQLGDEIAKGLGEKNRYLIRSIVIACGSGKKKILVESNNETQKIMRARKKNQYLLENKTKRPKIMSAPKKGHIDPPENETKLDELLKKEREEDSAFDSVKPLPPIEHLFQQHLVLDADKPVLVGGNIEDIQMET
uniref:Alba domain-containing protein n=1 Tax=Angiostrongylus cantonensis TaxID=6313 RepID=A0A0K0DP80_ANGCA